MEPNNILTEAKRRLSVADHFMFVTYPMIKETKMLNSIMDNVSQAVFDAMRAVLEQERKDKRVMHLTGNFYADLEVFRRNSSRYGFMPKHHYLLQELKSFQELKKKSHMEFVRGEKYVFAFEDFSTKTLTEEKVKKVIESATDFMQKAEAALRC